MPNGGVDQVARDLAARAIAMIETHERVCSERAKEAVTWRNAITGTIESNFNEVVGKLDLVTGAVRGIHGRMWRGGNAFVGVLLAVCGYLIAHHGL